MLTIDGLLDEILYYNSSNKNSICCIEEMSELTKVLTKKLRNSPKFNNDILLEEVAHVLLMCQVIAKEAGLDANDIFEVQKDAVRRMKADIK